MTWNWLRSMFWSLFRDLDDSESNSGSPLESELVVEPATVLESALREGSAREYESLPFPSV